MQPLPPVSVVELFPHERESLLAVLGSLSAEQWATATACAGWSVHDVALHILGGDIGNLSTAWRLFTKGLSKDAARPCVTFEGDIALAASVLDMVSILA